MLIYFEIFILSTLLIYVANKINDTNKFSGSIKKIIYYFLIFLGLIIPSILAGLRDYSIGTDILVYGNDWFTNALHAVDLISFISYASYGSIGPLYASLNYFVSRFTDNPHALYFVISLLENIGVYWAIKRQKDWLNVPYAMLVYYLLFYNYNLNILRQGLAIVIILWGFKYVREGKLFKYLLTIIVAMGFHNTAYFGIVIYLVYWISTNKSLSKLKYGLIVFFIIGTVLFKQIILFLMTHGILSNRYGNYIDGSFAQGGFWAQLLLSAPLLIYAIIFLQYKNKKLIGLVYLLILTNIMSFLNLNASYLNRLTQYISFMYVIFWPIFINEGNVKVKGLNLSTSKRIMYVIITIYLVLYWLIIYGYINSGETVPYLADEMLVHL